MREDCPNEPLGIIYRTQILKAGILSADQGATDQKPEPANREGKERHGDRI